MQRIHHGSRLLLNELSDYIAQQQYAYGLPKCDPRLLLISIAPNEKTLDLRKQVTDMFHQLVSAQPALPSGHHICTIISEMLQYI